MSKVSLLLVSSPCLQMLSCLGQANPSGVFPGTPPCPPGWFCIGTAEPALPPNFTATLSGAEANPPNNSPFTATATITLRDSLNYFGVTLTNVFYIYLHFPDSLLTNTANVSPALQASIQNKAGQTVASPDGPMIFEEINPYPDYPCSEVCPP